MTDSKRLTLRLPSELHKLLVESANADHRSLNREIEFLLWQAFRIDVDAFAGTRNAVQPAPDFPDANRPVGASSNLRSLSSSTRSGTASFLLLEQVRPAR